MPPLNWAGYLRFRDQFRAGMDERYFPIEWLDHQVASGEARFFRSDNAAIVAEIRVYPGGMREVHGLIAAGDKAEIVGTLIPKAIEWGVERGCGAASIDSRPGWSKAAKPLGFEVQQVTIRKELGNGA